MCFCTPEAKFTYIRNMPGSLCLFKIFSLVQRPNTKVACELILTYADIQIETELKIQKSNEEKDECMAKYIWITNRECLE